ncbi:MAG: histidinol dehydrogenase [Candidatus Pelagibacter bacterium]|jgi:histidinol dehydrogenase|nr:histidinol dehydrogenase [Candidatus Pelagibacter bacterium]
MIKVLNCKKKNYISQLNLLLEKRRSSARINTNIVTKIVSDIKKHKVKALLKYEKRFSNNRQIKPSKEKIRKAIRSLEPKIKKAIDFAYKRILKFHSKQKTKNIKYIDNLNNKLEYKFVPIESVGIYVPANLPSTLLMNVIPAKIAGVKRIVLVNPKINGKLNPAVLYVAKKLNINEVYSMGGAQAIASLAYIQKVNKIIGPGNNYVARAKREIFGDVGIEGMVAGPSEISIVADKFTNINEVLTSLIGQAEHDPNSQCILITKDQKLIDSIKKLISKKLNRLPRKKIAEKSLKNNGLIIKVYSDQQIVNVINEIAPEHLEANIHNFKKIIKKIYNAGSICIGRYSAMALTDYNVGTNHVLPTFGSARFSSGLNVSEFNKKISYITLSKKGIEVIGKKAITLAEYEGLIGHAQSIKSRIRRE